MLHVTNQKISVDYESMAEFIDSYFEDHVFVPDTCFFTAHEIPDRYWKFLMSKRIAITEGVLKELGPWKSKPNYNKDVVPFIAEIENSDGPPFVQADGPNWGSYWNLAYHYYTTLLTSRKDRVLFLLIDFEEENGRKPTDDELNNLIKELGSDRDVNLLRKAAKSGFNQNWWTDESLGFVRKL